MKFEVTVPHEIPDDAVFDLLVCALEGGSNYWYVILDDPAPKDVFHTILTGKGVTVGLLEGGDVNGQTKWLLNRHAVRLGLKMWAFEDEEGFKRFLNEDYDALDADAFLQYTLFGEIVFG